MISTGIAKLDQWIKGYQGITCIYGEAGSGKSNFCLVALINTLREGKNVFFLDLKNDFSLERFKQIAGEDYKQLLEHLFIFKVTSYKAQLQQIREVNALLQKRVAFSLVIIDSIDYYYKRLWRSKPDLAEGMLINQLKNMRGIARKVPVLFTSHVYTNIKNNKHYIAGWQHLRKHLQCLIELKKNNALRLALVKKPVVGNLAFQIQDTGIQTF